MSQNLAHFFLKKLLTNYLKCGIIIVSRGERNKPLLGLSPSEVKLDTPHKKHERTSRKPLDFFVIYYGLR